MKKRLFATILAVIFAASAFALSACNFTVEGTETWEYSAKNKADTVELFNDFFEDTFNNTNQIVTVKSGDSEKSAETLFVETIDGTKDFIAYQNGAKTYSFINGNDYIYAMLDDDIKTYWADKTLYDNGYFMYKSYVDIFDALPELGITYSCNVKGEGTISEKEENKKSTSTFTLELKNSHEGNVTITATAKNDLVESITISTTEDGKTSVITMTIVYGSASVTTPDISDWYKSES